MGVYFFSFSLSISSILDHWLTDWPAHEAAAAVRWPPAPAPNSWTDSSPSSSDSAVCGSPSLSFKVEVMLQLGWCCFKRTAGLTNYRYDNDRRRRGNWEGASDLWADSLQLERLFLSFFPPAHSFVSSCSCSYSYNNCCCCCCRSSVWHNCHWQHLQRVVAVIGCCFVFWKPSWAELNRENAHVIWNFLCLAKVSKTRSEHCWPSIVRCSSRILGFLIGEHRFFFFLFLSSSYPQLGEQWHFWHQQQQQQHYHNNCQQHEHVLVVPTIFVAPFGGGSGRLDSHSSNNRGRMCALEWQGHIEAGRPNLPAFLSLLFCTSFHFLSSVGTSTSSSSTLVLLRTWSRLIECVAAAAAAVYPFQEQRFLLRLFLFCPSFKRNCSVHYFYCYCCLHLLR